MAQDKAALRISADLLICTACGTQFPDRFGKTSCRICDDPRQFVPPTGQQFTTLAKMHEDGLTNRWQHDDLGKGRRVWSIWTEPKFAIGQRAILIQTPSGNVLWDCITLLDQETVDKILSLGGLSAIVISHPHYYTTYANWSSTFSCPVYISSADAFWLLRFTSPNAPNGKTDVRLFNEVHEEIVAGVTAIRCGGHFRGSLCLYWDQGVLCIADTLVTVPSGKNPTAPQPGDGVTSYSFMWSIPNMIPMSPDAIHGIWKALKDPRFHFDTTMGAFVNMDVKSKGPHDNVKGRILESMKITVRAMVGEGHAIMNETL